MGQAPGRTRVHVQYLINRADGLQRIAKLQRRPVAAQTEEAVPPKKFVDLIDPWYLEDGVDEISRDGGAAHQQDDHGTSLQVDHCYVVTIVKMA